MRRLFAPAIVLLAVTWFSGCLLVRPQAMAYPDQLSGKIVSSVIDNPTTVIAPPDVPPDGTGEPSVPVSGTAQPSTKVKIINNGRQVASGQADDKGRFIVQTPLNMGKNQITVQVPSGAPSNQVVIQRHPNNWLYRNRIMLLTGTAVGMASLSAVGFINFQATGRLLPRGKNRFWGGGNDEE